MPSMVSSAATVEPMVTPRASDDPADFGMRPAQAVLEAGAKIGRRTGDADRRQMLDDAGRGDLAGIVSAHAVGDQPQPAARLHQIAVFVELAHAALVADAIAFEGEGGFVQIASWRS